MVDKIVENQGGLHGRVTNNIYVRPFTLHEAEMYLRSHGIEWDRYQILQTYMIIGGIPFYYSLLDAHDSLVQNIDRLFFRQNGELRTEFDELYNALFTHAEKYVSVVQTLNKVREGMTREEISKSTGLKDFVLTKVLRNLERCDFIIRYSQYGNKTKGAIYRLVDYYTLFYYRFVETHNGKDEQWWSHHFQSHSIESWQGMSFELICLTHLNQIKRCLGISGIATEASAWRYVPPKGGNENGSQIDLLIDRADRIVNLCEMKFSINPFVITKGYEQTLRNRMGIFKEKTKTTKSLINTFVTTFGVANGKHHSIVGSEVVMDDLFEP